VVVGEGRERCIRRRDSKLLESGVDELQGMVVIEASGWWLDLVEVRAGGRLVGRRQAVSLQKSREQLGSCAARFCPIVGARTSNHIATDSARNECENRDHEGNPARHEVEANGDAAGSGGFDQPSAPSRIRSRAGN
jgi:hypothetical protein